MKTKNIVFILFACSAATLAAGSATGRSFFQPRLLWAEQMLTLHNGTEYDCMPPASSGFSFNAAAGFQASTHDSKFASYFLPNGKNDLVVKGANAPGPRDISAMWLQIVGDNTVAQPAALFVPSPDKIFDYERAAMQWINEYSSVISLRPRFESSGVLTHLSYCAKINRMPCQLTVGVPVLHVRNNMQLCETDVQNGFTKRSDVSSLLIEPTSIELLQEVQPQYSLSAIEAFNNPNKRFAKISQGALEKRGLGDVSLDLAVRPVSSVTIGLRGELPTASKGTAEYLFEPLLGSNGHGTLGAYAQMREALWSCDQGTLFLKAQLQYQAQFAGNQLRTFDLTAAGQWSRYLLLIDAANNPKNADSGVNFLTQSAHVSARQEGLGGLSLELEHKGFLASAGYSLFAREKERVSVRTQLPQNLFIVGQLASNNSGKRNISAGEKNSSIGNHIPVGHSAFVDPLAQANAGLALTTADLDVQSASMPKYFSHTVHASLGYAGRVRQQEVHCNLGGRYEMLRYGHNYNVYSLFAGLEIKI